MPGKSQGNNVIHKKNDFNQVGYIGCKTVFTAIIVKLKLIFKCYIQLTFPLPSCLVEQILSP